MPKDEKAVKAPIKEAPRGDVSDRLPGARVLDLRFVE
jgi:hypothetical protein